MTKLINLRRGSGLILVCLWPFLLGASECNTFSASADKTSDAALLFAAQSQINAQQYGDAINTLGGLSATGAASHDGLTTLASAHAGLCGLNLVTMASDVSQQLGAKSLMQLMYQEMHSATSYVDCLAAEGLIQQIPSAQVTADDQIFLAFVEFAKIGAVLVTAPSATTNPCLAVNVSDQEAGEIGAGVDIALQALQASGLSIASSLTSAAAAVCAPSGPLDCTITTWNGFSPAQYLEIRSIINTQELGLNTCPGSIGNSACICL